mmetsp:Transcript_22084/g.32184  ORF Transcript_22084/g.32184 Transcript_22084/m.32184 type:complete len:116 (+) Transcript_22084:77-424(+)
MLRMMESGSHVTRINSVRRVYRVPRVSLCSTPDPNVHPHAHSIVRQAIRNKNPALYGNKKVLTNQEKLRIAAVDIVSPAEAEADRKEILAHKVYGMVGLFCSLVGLGLGINIFLS